jgi:TPR repeat protein
LQWYRKAADQGHALAQLHLGVMYDVGYGVPKDEQQAYFWWLLASVGGDADAVKLRDQIEARITPQHRAAAQADARSWKPR